MAITYRRLLDQASLESGAAMDLSMDALDLGEFSSLHFVVTVVTAGDPEDTGKLVLKHAAVNEAGSYVDFGTPMQVALNEVGTSWFSTDDFTRYAAWSVSGDLSSPAVVTLDLVAKR